MLIIVIEIRIHRANAPQYLLKYSAPHMLPETRRPALQRPCQEHGIRAAEADQHRFLWRTNKVWNLHDWLSWHFNLPFNP